MLSSPATAAADINAANKSRLFPSIISPQAPRSTATSQLWGKAKLPALVVQNDDDDYEVMSNALPSILKSRPEVRASGCSSETSKASTPQLMNSYQPEIVRYGCLIYKFNKRRKAHFYLPAGATSHKVIIDELVLKLRILFLGVNMVILTQILPTP